MNTKTTLLKDEDAMQDNDAREIRASLSHLTTEMHKQYIATIEAIAKIRTDNKVNTVKIGGFVTLLTMAVASVVSILMLKIFGS